MILNCALIQLYLKKVPSWNLPAGSQTLYCRLRKFLITAKVCMNIQMNIPVNILADIPVSPSDSS